MEDKLSQLFQQILWFSLQTPSAMPCLSTVIPDLLLLPSLDQTLYMWSPLPPALLLLLR